MQSIKRANQPIVEDTKQQQQEEQLIEAEKQLNLDFT